MAMPRSIRKIRTLIWFTACWLGAIVPAVFAAEPLRLAVSPSPLSLPIFVAQSEGYFEQMGVHLKITECVGGHRCLKQVLDRQADLATASTLPVVFNSFERSDYVVLATFSTASDDGKLVARKSAGIQGPGNLPGKRIGAVMRSSSQCFLDLFLLTHGIDPRKVNVVPLQPEELLGAIKDGRVDAVAAWEPYAYQVVQGLNRDGIVLPSPNVYMLLFNLVAHRSIALDQHANLVRMFKALQKANQFIEQEPAKAKQILRERLKVDQAFIDWVWTGISYRMSLDQALLSGLESEARWAVREQHVTSKSTPNFLSFIDVAPLRAAVPNAVTLAR